MDEARTLPTKYSRGGALPPALGAVALEKDMNPETNCVIA